MYDEQGNWQPNDKQKAIYDEMIRQAQERLNNQRLGRLIGSYANAPDYDTLNLSPEDRKFLRDCGICP